MKKKILKSADLHDAWVEAFKTGKVKDMAGVEHDFSESDLNDLNEGIHGQLEAGYQPPMVKGHPKLDDPRVGSIVDSKVEGGVLKVKLDDVNADFADEVKKGGFKYLSAAVYSNLKKGLRHLGALGAHAPAMKGMAPLCFGEGVFAEMDKGVTEQDVSVFSESYAWDRLVPASAFERLVFKISNIADLFRSQREQLIEKSGIEVADKTFPEYAIKELEGVKDVIKDSGNFPKQVVIPNAAENAEASSFAEPDSGSEEQPELTENEENGRPLENGGDPQAQTFSPNAPTVPDAEGHAMETERLSEENAALRAEIASLKADKLADQRQRASAAFSETLDNAISDGRCNQVLKDSLMKVFGVVQNLPTDGEGCFGEGDDRVNVNLILTDTVKNLPRIVEFGEMDIAEPKGSASVTIEKYKAEQELKGRKMTYADAAEECFK